MELHLNGEPEVTRRFSEHGLSQHESFIREPGYLLEYIDFLVQRNDEENLRVLFERALHPSAMPADKARLVWEWFVQLELCLSRTGGSLTNAQNVENRMNQVYNDGSGPSGLLALWKRCSFSGCGMHPEGKVDSAFSNRREMLSSHRGEQGQRRGDRDVKDSRNDPQGGNTRGLRKWGTLRRGARVGGEAETAG